MNVRRENNYRFTDTANRLSGRARTALDAANFARVVSTAAGVELTRALARNGPALPKTASKAILKQLGLEKPEVTLSPQEEFAQKLYEFESSLLTRQRIIEADPKYAVREGMTWIWLANQEPNPDVSAGTTVFDKIDNFSAMLNKKDFDVCAVQKTVVCLHAVYNAIDAGLAEIDDPTGIYTIVDQVLETYPPDITKHTNST